MSDIITVTGNIAAEPESKRTSGGVPIATFRVASTHRRYDRDNARWVDDYTNWYSVSAFRGLAEHALRSLHKGDRVVLTGRLRVRDWETSTSRGTAVEITADSIGHDLLWGTTEFQRAVTSNSDATTREADEWAVAAVDESQRADAAEALPVNGIRPEPGAEAAPEEQAGPPAQLELIGAERPF